MSGLPFSLDEKARKPLSQQAADGFRAAIKEGFYADGAVLPTLRELAQRWHVSLKVPSMAYARLAEEGYVVLRAGRGAVVNRSGVRAWSGNVLFVSVGLQGGFFVPQFLQTIRGELESANLRFDTMAVPTDARGGPSCGRLADYLQHAYDLVILLSGNPRLRRMVRKSASASLVVGWAGAHDAAADVSLSSDEAERAFAEDCRRHRVQHLRILYHGQRRPLLADRLAAVGIGTETVRLTPRRGYPTGLGLQHAAYAYWIGQGRASVSRASRTSVYFADDNLLLGSLLAFARLGIAVPRDVRVATLANRGSDFPYGLSFTRIESDPVQFGREVARHALRLLHERTKPAPHVCRLRYVPGDTFPA